MIILGVVKSAFLTIDTVFLEFLNFSKVGSSKSKYDVVAVNWVVSLGKRYETCSVVIIVFNNIPSTA